MRLLQTIAIIYVLLLSSWTIADDKPKGPERWEKSMKAFEAQDAKKFPQKGGVLFIGSSSIRKWDLNKSFPDKAYINRGFGGSEISDSIHFADRIVFPYEPKKIVMYAGDNDIGKGKTAARVVSDFEQFVKLVHDKQPKTKIVFIAIKPSIKRWDKVATMRDANQQIAALCSKHERLAFADIDTPMIGDDGKPMADLFAEDGLHLSDKGYEVWTIVVQPLISDEVTLHSAVDPGPNKSDEAITKEFSMDHAVNFLDNVALNWQKKRKCFTCHTNYAYLYARPQIDANAPAHRAVRDFAEELVRERWEGKGPRWDAEVVATAAALAFNDAATTGKLHKTTRTALDRMWESQRDDGGWGWLNCNWPPMEHDDHYGVTLAAIAVGTAPDEYAQTEKAKHGMAKIAKYLKETNADHLHQRTMTLWASSYHDDLLSKQQKQEVIDELLALQHDDGGWAIASLGKWDRSDGGEQDKATSDGYGTGFVVYVLRQAGIPQDDARLQRGVSWLKQNQRASGRWFTRSLNKDSKHYISHVGTAFAVMAITVCEPKK